MFAIPSMRKPRLGSPKRRKFQSEVVKKNIETNVKIKRTLKHLDLKNQHKQVQKSLQNRQKSCYLQLRVYPATPMVLQGGPEVPKWPPKVFRKCQNCFPRWSRDAKMAPRMSKRTHQGPQMATPRSSRGPAAEGVALKIFFKNASIFS